MMASLFIISFFLPIPLNLYLGHKKGIPYTKCYGGLAEIKDKYSWWDEFVQCEKEGSLVKR